MIVDLLTAAHKLESVFSSAVDDVVDKSRSAVLWGIGTFMSTANSSDTCPPLSAPLHSAVKQCSQLRATSEGRPKPKPRWTLTYSLV